MIDHKEPGDRSAFVLWKGRNLSCDQPKLPFGSEAIRINTALAQLPSARVTVLIPSSSHGQLIGAVLLARAVRTASSKDSWLNGLRRKATAP